MPDYSNVPFNEAIAYLSQKISIPTNRPGMVLNAEHDAAFIVAGAKGSLLADIRSITERAITQGWPLDKYKAKFNQVADGWSGNKDWRAQIIYQTNMRMAYAAGRYTYQLDPETIKAFPYLQAVHSDHSNYRPLHKALDGKIFKAQEIPLSLPNGFFCGCRYISVDKEMLGDRTISDLKRGDKIDGLPIEPEQGFDYVPNQSSATARRNMIQDIMKRLPPKERQSVEAEVKKIDNRYQKAAELLPTLDLSASEISDRLTELEAIANPTEEEIIEAIALRAIWLQGTPKGI